jgi:hypothetical protein
LAFRSFGNPEDLQAPKLSNAPIKINETAREVTLKSIEYYLNVLKT